MLKHVKMCNLINNKFFYTYECYFISEFSIMSFSKKDINLQTECVYIILNLNFTRTGCLR